MIFLRKRPAGNKQPSMLQVHEVIEFFVRQFWVSQSFLCGDFCQCLGPSGVPITGAHLARLAPKTEIIQFPRTEGQAAVDAGRAAAVGIVAFAHLGIFRNCFQACLSQMLHIHLGSPKSTPNFHLDVHTLLLYRKTTPWAYHNPNNRPGNELCQPHGE